MIQSQTKNFGEQWTLDPTGNWDAFQQDDNGDATWDLKQARDHNHVNEIDVDDDHGNAAGASITASTGTNWFDPTYDAAGNMTAVPKPTNVIGGHNTGIDKMEKNRAGATAGSPSSAGPR